MSSVERQEVVDIGEEPRPPAQAHIIILLSVRVRASIRNIVYIILLVIKRVGKRR